MAWKKQDVMKHTKEGKLFDKEKSKKIRNMFSSDEEKQPLTEYELVQIINKILAGQEYIIDDESQNVLMVAQEIKIATLKEEEMKCLAEFVSTYSDPDIYRFLKYIIYNQVVRQDKDMKDILGRLVPGKNINYTLINKEPMKKFVSFFNQDFIKNHGLDKDVNGESEAINAEDIIPEIVSEHDDIIRKQYPEFTDEEWKKKRNESPYNKIPFIIEEILNDKKTVDIDTTNEYSI